MSKARVSGIVVLLLAGCGESDERLTRVALESTGQQADQNRRMGELQREIAGGTRVLIEADAQARQQFAEFQREMAEQQAEIGRQRDQLESERRSLAAARQRDSLLARAVEGMAQLMACLLPLAIGLLVLWPRPETPESAELAVLLVDELSRTPLRLTGPPLPAESPNAGEGAEHDVERRPGEEPDPV